MLRELDMNELPGEIREGNSRVWEKRRKPKLKNREDVMKVEGCSKGGE